VVIGSPAGACSSIIARKRINASAWPSSYLC
jgi:hypothetical protein